MYLDKNFDITKEVNKNYASKKDFNIDKEEYEKIEKRVKDEITAQRGRGTKGNEYNEIISKAILGNENFKLQLKAIIKQYIKEFYPNFAEEEAVILANKIYINNYGLGAIEDLVEDKSINEIWVNGYDKIWIEKNGSKIRLNDRKFKNNDDVLRVMRQMLQYDKKEINRAHPTVESKLMDGSRVTLIIQPVSPVPYINIRKYQAFEVSEESMITSGTSCKEQLEDLKTLVKGRANMLIIGETGSGKSSLLKHLYSYTNPNLRTGVIETDFELKLTQKYPERNIFEYEEHEELGVTLPDLFPLCLRSSPDIIYVGEVREPLTAELLIKAMRRGHPGSMSSFHTNDADTAIDDIMDLILEDGKKRNPLILKDMITKAVDIIIHIHKCEDKVRRIMEIVEVTPKGNNTLWLYSNNKFNKLNNIEDEKLLNKMRLYGVSKEEIDKLNNK